MKRKTLEIDVQGEGAVKAGDITHDSDVEILNPDLHIATLCCKWSSSYAINCETRAWLYSCCTK